MYLFANKKNLSIFAILLGDRENYRSLGTKLENKALHNHEKNISTFPQKKKKQAWLQGKNVNP